MPKNNGTITLQDIITDEALKWGEKYKEQAERAISANNALIKSAKTLNETLGQYKTAGNNSQLVDIKTKEKNAIEKIVQSLKEEQSALTALNEERQRQMALQKSIDQVDKARKKTTDESTKALLDEQRVIKNNLDIKNKELIIAQKEAAAKKRNTTLTAEERVQNEILNKAKKQQARENLGLVGAYEKLNRQRTEAQKKLANLLAAEERNIKEVKQAQAEYKKLNDRIKQVDAATDIFTKNIGNYKSAFSGTAGALNNLVSAFGVTTGIYLFVNALKRAVSIARDFEKSNATLTAVLQQTSEQTQELRDDAIRLGQSTVKTAQEVTELQIAYARLGFTQKEILDVTEATIQGSIALNSELDKTAELTGAVIRTFDDFSSTDAPEIMDIMALATAKSALNFQKLETGIPIVAGAANAAGIPFTKLVALLGKLADAGIDTSSSATALRNIFIEAAADGLNYEQILQKIKDSQDKLTTANDEFGKRAAVSASVLAQNIDKTNELDVALQNAAGTAKTMADKELNTLDGAIKLLTSAWEGYILRENEAIDATGSLKEVISFLAQNLDIILDVLTKAIVLWVTYKAATLAASAATRIAEVSTKAYAVAQALANGGIAAARVEMKALNATMKTNVFGLVITAVVGLIYYFSKLHKTLEETTEQTKQSTEEFLKSRDVQRQNNKSLEEMADRYDELKKSTKLSKEEQKELNDVTKALGKTVPEATEKINEYGDALAINTDKIREYTKEQREYLALQKKVELKKENDLLKEQSKALYDINLATKEQLGRLEGEGYLFKSNFFGDSYIKTIDGQLKLVDKMLDETRNLTDEELLEFKTRKLAAEGAIKDTKARISAIQELIGVTRKSTEATSENNAVKEDTPRTIAIIDAEIKAERDKIDSLTFSTKEQGRLIDKKIADLQKERDAIYKNEKTLKDDKKIREEYLNKLKKIDEDAYNLAVFRLNRIKDQNDEIIEDADATYKEQADAIISNENVLLAINEEATEKKLKEISRYNDKVRDLTDADINILLNGGEIKKKLNNEEILAIEQYQLEKEKIYKKSEKDLDKLQLTDFEKRIADRATTLNNSLNEDIIRENTRFANERVAEGKREQAIENHEKRIADLKREYAIKALNDQITAMEALLATESVTAEKRKEIEGKISNAKKEISDLTTENYIENNDKIELSEEEKAEKIKGIATDLKNSLVDFANTIFDARIQRIDDELQRLEDFYSRQQELAEDDQRKKDFLEKEAEKKREAIEKKKREEQRKQAIFNKAVKATEIIGATSLAIISALAQVPKFDFGISAGAISAAYAAIGAVQLANLIAQPIPKYKKGRKGGPKEVAWVGDGFVNEIIESKKGQIRVTPAIPTLTKLDEGDTVHSSKEAYLKHVKNTVLMNISRESERAKSFQMQINEDKKTDKLEAAIETAIEKGFKKAKININQKAPKVDISHTIWAHKNVKWN